MMHGIRAKKTDWLKNYKLPHVFVNDVWEMCAKTAKYKFTRPILSLMAGLILFGSDRGYNEALDDGAISVSQIRVQYGGILFSPEKAAEEVFHVFQITF